MQLLYSCKWGKKPGLIGRISVDMKKEYGDAEGQKSAKYGLYCRYLTNNNAFVVDNIMLFLC